MGIYVCGVGSDDWSDEEVLGPTARALAAELRRRGLDPCPRPAPRAPRPRSGASFEEKLNRPLGTFEDLCRQDPAGEECYDALLGWDLLVPVAFDGAFELPVPSPYDDVTTVRSAHAARAAAQRVADRIALPPQVPLDGGNLALTNWFDGPAVADAAATHPGPWSQATDAAFYAALYLGAAEHAIRHTCPMHYV
ncbi:hypothetical protein ACIBEA_42190 [Streptomyces sp. NPDC051555]|uniref:hypothetical protein n=1 Tax=Streptomyces sp. NPDC051555 TaxID=3365657 RepID=UPI003794A061